MNATRFLSVLLALGLLASACSPDVRDGIGPRVPVPNVAGLVLRDGSPADDLEVELRDTESSETLAETDTDSGRFEFSAVPVGSWEIKVSGEVAGDFDSVSREFDLLVEDTLLELADLDIWAYDCEALEPTAAATLPRPSIFSPMTFSWRNPVDPGQELLWARVNLYDAEGDPVWSSEKELVEEATWNGIGDEGDYEGVQVPAGAYYWRLKLAFSDTLEARLDPRDLVLE